MQSFKFYYFSWYFSLNHIPYLTRTITLRGLFLFVYEGESKEYILISQLVKTEKSDLVGQSRLELYSILNTKCIRVIDPEGPEKYNNTKMKLGWLFTAFYSHHTAQSCEYKNSGEKSIPQELLVKFISKSSNMSIRWQVLFCPSMT